MTPSYIGKIVKMRKVEDMYLNGYSASEITAALNEDTPIAYGTVRNYISSIRKKWGKDLKPELSEDGAKRYYASLLANRRMASTGWTESSYGEYRIKGREIRLVLDFD